MNWYKKAQQRSLRDRWRSFIGGFKAGVIIGALAWSGISITQIQADYVNDADQTEQQRTEHLCRLQPSLLQR